MRLAQDPIRSTRSQRLVMSVLRPVWRLRRGMTLGAQGVIVDGEGRVLLVRHSYRPGWCFPGGGVEWGETLEFALARELEEEVGVSLTGPAVLHGMFSNHSNFPGDHIGVFLVRDWTRQGEYRARGEIAETGMFAPDALPAKTDRGTRNRVEEIFGGAPVSGVWA